MDKQEMSPAMIWFGYDKINWLKLGEVPHHRRGRLAKRPYTPNKYAGNGKGVGRPTKKPCS